MSLSAEVPMNALQLRQIDEICNAFESACSLGQIPNVDQYIEQAPREIRPQLLAELIQIELHYRSAANGKEMTSRPTGQFGPLSNFQTAEPHPEYPAIPGYYISQELGRGGMGVVYLATDLRLLRQVALKMLHPLGRLNEENRRRFMGEARSAARLHHPNLVQVFDAGEFDGQPYLVFELVEGGTLSQKIRQGGMSFEECARLMEQICRAAHFAHQRHIVHRDLKPSNVLIGLDGLPRISDFGLAKRLDEDIQQTVSGVLVGTPAYMAPEQASGSNRGAHAAVDIYSLGAILYEMLIGQPPFKAPSVVETLDLLRSTEPIALRSINPKIPRDLETICLKCLQKEPAKRYMSAKVMAEDLARFLRGDSIVARPAGKLERTGRWCRRHPLPASLVAALVLVIVGGFAAVWSQWSEARSNAEKYRVERDLVRAAMDVANEKTREAEEHRQNAEKHLAASESRFRKAQAPIQELIRLGSELVRQPNMNNRGRKALEQATRFLQDLMREKIDDPQIMAETASAVSSFGWTLLEHGLFVDGEAAIRDALVITSELIAVAPESLRYQRLHRDALWRHGIAHLRLGRHQQAEDLLQKSVECSEVAIKLPGANSSDHVALGAALSNLAIELKANKKSAAAAQTRMQSVQVLRRCAESYPRDSTVPSNLSLALTNLAADLWQEDRFMAEKMALEALAIRRKLAQSIAAREESAYLVSSLLLLANWYHDTQRPAEAQELLSEALEFGERARHKFTEVYSIRLQYINALRSAFRFAWSAQDLRRAEDHLSQILAELKLAIREFPDDESFKLQQARAIFDTGRIAERQSRKNEAAKYFVQALRELTQARATSPNPARFIVELDAVSEGIFRLGTRFEFEAEKLEASRVQCEVVPNDPVRMNVLAWRLTVNTEPALRDYGQAEKLVRQAIAINRQQPFYFNTLAVCLYHQNRLAEAEEALDQSQQLQTSEPAADWYFMSRIRSRQCQHQTAIEYYNRAEKWRKQHRPQDPELIAFAEEAQADL